MNPGEMARGYHNVGVNWKFRVVQRGPTKLGKKRGHPVWGTTNVASPHSGIVATVIASHAKGLGSNRWLNNFFFFVFKHSYAFTFFFFFSAMIALKTSGLITHWKLLKVAYVLEDFLRRTLHICHFKERPSLCQLSFSYTSERVRGISKQSLLSAWAHTHFHPHLGK